ncbi:MAG TPA: signal peptidase I [Mycobacteriales bacterium]|jgi:signal peptidase|nr:signal peptidase I [Mycobacteriales bacterium]
MGAAARKCGAALLLLAAVAALGVATAARTGAVRFSRVLTGSMTPTVARGSLVVSAPTDAASIRAGQLLVFAPPGGDPTVHRVVSVTREDGHVLVRTKGDANAAADPWTIDAAHSTVHRVVHHSAAAGTALDVTRRSGVAVALALLALVATAKTLRWVWGTPSGRHRGGAGRAAVSPAVRWLAEERVSVATGAGMPGR